jgi:ribonuclease G
MVVMPSELLINVTSKEARVALLEYGTLTELYVERSSERSLVGNIYKGRVVKVLPGMQACFVDIGLSKAAFLYVSDVQETATEYGEFLGLETSIDYPASQPPPDGVTVKNIEDLITEGQEIAVQVARDPIGTKGARITTNISLPGRHLVLLPYMGHVGISRRIHSEKERQRLRELIHSIRADDMGFIARTASEGVDEDELRAEMTFLIQLWELIRANAERGAVPRLLYTDLDMTLRAVRDLMVGEIDRVVIDSAAEYQRILGFLDAYLPHFKDRVELYEEKEPLFDAYHVEMEIARALEKKIWLKSGGYIFIEETEALTSIDVNTGRYVGRYNQEETILKINLEAAKEIAYQLRLRNIGGIIIIDFIDMDRESSREQVFQTLQSALKRDRSRTNILKISELGLVEMTRKRVTEGVSRQLCEPCPYCEGHGWIKSTLTLCYDVLRDIKREAAHSISLNGDVFVEVHPEVAQLLFEEERQGLEELEGQLNRRILVKPKEQLHRTQYDVWIE